MQKIFNTIFGDPNKRVIDALRKDVEKINALEPTYAAMSDDDLRGTTVALRDRLAKGEEPDAVLFDAFAAVREAARRTLGQRHFDVQLMGGLVLHRRGIAEMRTGEGKTLTATAPLFANALVGKGAHLVTVNDYLAKLGAKWMGQVFAALGMTTGIIQHEGGFIVDPSVEGGLRPVERKAAYAADITYGTNNEFGFDHLRDNMAPTLDHCVMRDLHFVIVDEVDSILIDEARTPLIISAPAEESNALYQKYAQIMKSLKENEDFNVDEKMNAATFSEQGIDRVEKALGIENLYAVGDNTQHYAESALKAWALYKRDVQYVVKDGGVVIVDEFTGRMMPGRRFSEGIHQAIEAKEGLEVQRESQTLATITFQNFFRMYKKLSGMTGTAATEAEEFGKIYELEVTSIPTNKAMQRIDMTDRVYKNEVGKFMAVAKEVKERHEKGQPVLVGTISIEKNELLGALLTREGVPFNLLNAKNHAAEAEYIAQAGRLGAVTVATNMAGRGVDIMLGGNPPDPAEAEKVRALGGLHVIGTERHESRRIDNQLRGRSGRQGDPGSTQFYVSMEDDLMRIFGSDRVKGIMDKLGIPDDMPIENGMVTGSIEKAQQRVEGHHFDSRKHLLEYDDVLNKHREVIYRRRHEILESYAKEDGAGLREVILDVVEGEVEQVVLFHTGAGDASKNDHDGKEIVEVVETIIAMTDAQKAELSALAGTSSSGKMHAAEDRTKLIETIMGFVRAQYDAVQAQFEDPAQLRNLERAVIIRASDTLWIEHLSAMTALRHSIGLHGYAQRDPLVEYKKEAFGMFQRLLSYINQEIAYSFFKHAKHISDAKAAQILAQSLLARAGMQTQGPAKEMGKPAEAVATGVVVGRGMSPIVNADDVGRNEMCPCGSGKKYKKCHGT
ncbi:MAG: preprotein translocase subunit SecA [Candidatus Uhrbacteria bacterium]